MKWFLGAIFAFFMAALIAVALVARQAHPVLLDEHGRPIEEVGVHHQ